MGVIQELNCDNSLKCPIRKVDIVDFHLTIKTKHEEKTYRKRSISTYNSVINIVKNITVSSFEVSEDFSGSFLSSGTYFDLK